ncbi:hypothetical protein [Burkholderia sp. AW49-1]
MLASIFVGAIGFEHDGYESTTPSVACPRDDLLTWLVRRRTTRHDTAGHGAEGGWIII